VRRREIVDHNVGRQTGRLFKAAGEGFTIEIASGVQAMTCAMGGLR
jgi:hypothetical protein